MRKCVARFGFSEISLSLTTRMGIGLVIWQDVRIYSKGADTLKFFAY
jgi:hypothetical protein